MPFLSTKLMIQAGCVLAIVGALSFGAWSVVHSIQQGAIKNIVAADTAHAAQVDAAGAKIDAAQSSIDASSADTSATHQVTLAKQAAVIKSKVHTHVHEPSPTAPRVVGCVTYGLVRQLDAAALGVDPDTLALPSGVSDDACAPVENADLASVVGDNYATYRAIAQELSDLQANVTAKVDATAPKK